jgi:hypothetical protein
MKTTILKLNHNRHNETGEKIRKFHFAHEAFSETSAIQHTY